jgi:peptide/nickel transport system permease protein
MLAYIIRRTILAIVIIVLSSITVFFGMRLLPGDPILMLITANQQQQFNEEQLQQLRHENGLDRPMVIQYINWIGDIVHGELGTSILTQMPVSDEIYRRLPISIYIGGIAFIIGHLLGIPAGIICAVRRGKWLDTALTTLANLGITMPNFWLGILLIYIFGLQLRWLPLMGYTSPFANFWMSTKQIIMPVICLAFFPLAGVTRQTRSSMLEVMSQDYIRTAWSKGLRERVILVKHAMKNGMIPVLTLAGVGVATIIGGGVVIETVFNIPGLGRLAVSSVISQDYPYVQAISLFVAIAVVFANLFVDVAYGWLDPRIRFG